MNEVAIAPPQLTLGFLFLVDFSSTVPPFQLRVHHGRSLRFFANGSLTEIESYGLEKWKDERDDPEQDAGSDKQLERQAQYQRPRSRAAEPEPGEEERCADGGQPHVANPEASLSHFLPVT
jgi:hypothetical protein